MLINTKCILKNSFLCFCNTHCYFYCQSNFNKHSTRLILITRLYFTSNFFKFVRIILSPVSNICNTKFFLKMSLIYPYFTPIFYNFNIVFYSMGLQWIEQMSPFYAYTRKKQIFLNYIKCSIIFDSFPELKSLTHFLIFKFSNQI